MKSVVIEMELSYRYKVEYDPDSEEFKAALEDFKQIIDDDGDEEGLLKHVVWTVGHREEQDVEGVGHVKKNSQRSYSPQFEDSGINLIPIWEEEAEINIQ